MKNIQPRVDFSPEPPLSLNKYEGRGWQTMRMNLRGVSIFGITARYDHTDSVGFAGVHIGHDQTCFFTTHFS